MSSETAAFKIESHAKLHLYTDDAARITALEGQAVCV